jgi:hypothetical protein
MRPCAAAAAGAAAASSPPVPAAALLLCSGCKPPASPAPGPDLLALLLWPRHCASLPGRRCAYQELPAHTAPAPVIKMQVSTKLFRRMLGRSGAQPAKFSMQLEQRPFITRTPPTPYAPTVLFILFAAF